MDYPSIVLIFLSLLVGGFFLEALVGQFHHFIYKKPYKKYHYSFARYIFFLLFPITAFIFVLAQIGLEVLTVFLSFSLIGTFLEWLSGFSYHMSVGQRLWTYHRYSIGSYTSFLSIPLWGLGGVLFWLLVSVFK